MTNISFDELKIKLFNILVKHDFEIENAELCSKIFAENTLVGVASHGINRFSAFINLVKSGHIIPNAKPTLVNSFGAWEQWDGNLGPGPLNAWRITERVIELSKENGVGVAALKNTNHWMRPGAFGWEAAERGHILICWTNTIPIMPPWKAKTPAVGNNPITMAVPRSNGHVVLDMALSQYAYGKLSTFRREGKELPYPGGFDTEGKLSTNAAAIYDTQRSLPIGYWKGAGLAILFDLLAAILSGGKSTNDLGKTRVDSGMSQVFICFDPSKSYSAEAINNIADEIIESVKNAEPANKGASVSYPGERIIETRKKNLKDGIYIHPEIWEKIQRL
ncbi:MAG: 3-dehydro-L-gulonate 2-dehydrogenase [Melioribacteraceae bacterium]|nr:3-dehydro-L-gulonate 2-dehydrogenase [Melioribacteraceae bacterium]